jgi:sulfonate transport system permease protein
MNRRLISRVNPLGWLTLAVVVGIWQVVISTRLIHFQYTPSPSEVANGFASLVSSGAMGAAVWHTTQVALIAGGIATGLGVLLGTAVGLSPLVRLFTIGTIDFLRTVPVVALMPVALLVWGTSSKAEIIVASYAALWPVTLNTTAGVRGVHPLKRDVARTFRLSRFDMLSKIVLPAATPSILVGLRLSIVTALVVAIVAEMLINPHGIGYGLVFTQSALRPNETWAYAIVAGVMGLVSNLFLLQIVRRVGTSMGAATR